VPGKDAKPVEVAAFRKALGAPDKPDGYQFAMPDGREATEADKAFQGTMGQLFHQAGVSAEQAKVLDEGWNAWQAKQEEVARAADQQYVEQTMAALKAKWGPDTDKNLA